MNFLNNASIAAFFGALSAFLLVIINDCRRDRKKRKIIKNEIEVAFNHSKNKVETVKRNRSSLQDHNKIIIAPILKFNPTVIRQLSIQILDILKQDQRQAIDAICYTMESVDGLLESALKRAEQLLETDGIDRNHLCEQLIIDYNDAIVNLNRLKEMCDNYTSGKFNEIIAKQYIRTEYEE